MKARRMIGSMGRKIGLDGAIAYSSAARVVQAVAGVISIFFIGAFLTGEEQGFYFTFGSILAIQVFFELGFTGIITQYVAHETAYLTIEPDGSVTGDETHRSRLAYLLRFCTKWYAVVTLLFLLVIIVAGFIYFNRYDKSGGAVEWRIPWIVISLSTALKLFQSPFTSYYMGLGYVKEMNKLVFFQQLVIPIVCWLMLAFGMKLYAAAVNALVGSLIWFLFVGSDSRLCTSFAVLWKQKITEKISYMKEIFPFQWKIAVSWISGYFIFQLFNPVLFATEGAQVAGQMGMTLTVLNAIQAFALSWQVTKVPTYSRMVELRQWGELDTLFNRTLRQMVAVCTVLLAGMFFCIWLLDVTQLGFRGEVLADRFLGYLPMLLMMLPLLANQFVNSWATYLRCHNQEPVLVQSVVMGVCCLLSTLLLGRMFGLYGITCGYCALTLFMSLPWVYLIFIRKKKEWHNEP